MDIGFSRRSLLLTAAAGTALVLTPAGPAAASPSTAARLRELESSYDGRIGAFALDTATGAAVGYRAAERFPLCSTFKALAAGAILHTARRSDPGLLDRRVFWTDAEVLPSSPVTGAHVADGLTVAELCDAAIRFSDNTAGNMLLKQLGGPAGLTRFFRDLGDPVSRLDRWETDLNIWSPDERRDTTMPAAVGYDLHALTVGRALVDADQQRLIGWLRASVTGGARIRAGLPATWTVGDKTGTGPVYAAANDIAVAWPPSAPPLVLAIYTNRNQPDATADNAVVAGTATILAEALGKV